MSALISRPGLASVAVIACLALSACSTPAGVPTTGSGASSASGVAASASGVGQTPSSPIAGGPSTSTTASSSSGPTASFSAAPITATGPITMSFIGDTHFENKLQSVAEDPNGMARLKPYLSKSDITVANLESAITDGPGSPQPDKQFTFHAPSSALKTMANAGIDVAGMANNHAGDWNDAGVNDTLRAKKSAPLKVIGIGKTVDEATAPAVFTVNGVSIAVLNASNLWEKTTEFHTAGPSHPGIATNTPEQPEAKAAFVAAVKDASSKYDVVVTFMHYGTELEKCATDKQFATEAEMKAAGADMIIGGHSHRVQAGGWDGNTYVDYGLGSFTWWMKGSDPSTGVLTVSIDPQLVQAKRDARAKGTLSTAKSVVSKQSWQAMTIGDSGLPYVPNKSSVDAMVADRDSLQGCSKLSNQPG